MNYEILIEQKQKALVDVIKTMESEIDLLKKQHNEYMKLKSGSWMRDIEIYLKSVSQHSYRRSDGRFIRVIPFLLKEENFVCLIQWNANENANITITIKYINPLEISGDYLKHLKNHIFGISYKHSSIESDEIDKERFSYIKKILEKHWKKEWRYYNNDKDHVVLISWIRSFFEEKVFNLYAVKKSTKRFGI